jgi:hypothetical protein
MRDAYKMAAGLVQQNVRIEIGTLRARAYAVPSTLSATPRPPGQPGVRVSTHFVGGRH